MPAGTVEVDLGNRVVTVPVGGLYDRFRMDTDLDEVARDPRVSGVEFFRRLPKTEVDAPFGPTLTPNFYYRVSTARLVMLAPIRAIRTRLPAELAPLELVPGIGLVSAMFFRYDVCDIDFYTEAAIAVAVRPARHRGPGFIDLAAALRFKDVYSYVLSLPVSSEIAQVRGHDGYGFPKWVTEIDVDVDRRRTEVRVSNDAGSVDVALSAPTPRQRTYRSGQCVTPSTSYTTMGDAWYSTLSQTHVLSTGAAYLPRNVNLEIGQGHLASDLRTLRPIRTVQFEVMAEAQVALHMPVPFSIH